MKQYLPTTIDDLLSNFNIELKPVDSKDYLSEEQIQTKLNDFKKFIANNKNRFGDYEILINEPHSTGFSAIFFSFDNPADTKMKGRFIIQDGNPLAECCDFCDQRLACLVIAEYELDGKCDWDDDTQKEVLKTLNQQFTFNYPKENVGSFLLENGFQEKAYGDYAMKDVYEKDGIIVYVH
ncbi:hypothetical protein CON36_29910 [Bacillus cereus]|uniref:Uncharacterized protein n=2 Tax=Bacillus cereus group TaxID=86661 RepID=A0A9X6STZ6_BACCE|nr:MULTISPECIES: hypothetical protein [Bacillus cereus group]PDZ95155.1 hypothetical protein CON36_29910 [Bacillus cereus]PFJ38780.1 hypothetical protein COJ15_17030 [Bacillus thuringiensis]